MEVGHDPKTVQYVTDKLCELAIEAEKKHLDKAFTKDNREFSFCNTYFKEAVNNII